MRNPFRNEADAFRVLTMIAAAAGLVIAATVLVSGWVGAVLALLAVSLGIYSTIGWLRAGLAQRPEAEPEGPDDVSGSEARSADSLPRR